MRTKLRPMVVKPKPLVLLDRPGWIPPHITENWDPDPYAYQTEEEMMPAGGPHGQLLVKLTKVLDDELKKRGLMLLIDTFMLYRDHFGTKRRIAPDLQIISRQSPTPKSYNLDHSPPPYCVMEIVSPESQEKDFNQNVVLYLEELQIPAYLVIEPKTLPNQLEPQIELHLWQLVGGRAVKMWPDGEGKYTLPEIGLDLVAKGPRFVFSDAVTGQEVFDLEQWNAAYQQERHLRKLAEARAKVEAEARRVAFAKIEQAEALAEAAAEAKEAAEAKALAEAEARQVAEAKVETEAEARQAAEAKVEAEAEARQAAEAKVEAEAEARQVAEAKAKAAEAKAKAEAEARQAAEAKAKAEAQARQAAEAKAKAAEEELARLRALLASQDDN